MKKIIIAIAAMLMLAACKKEPIIKPQEVQPFGDHHRWPVYWSSQEKQ